MRRYAEKMFWKNTQPKSGCPEKKLNVSTLPLLRKPSPPLFLLIFFPIVIL